MRSQSLAWIVICWRVPIHRLPSVAGEVLRKGKKDEFVRLDNQRGEIGHSDDLPGTILDTEGVGVWSGTCRLAVGGAFEESLDFAVGVPDTFCCLAAR